MALLGTFTESFYTILFIKINTSLYILSLCKKRQATILSPRLSAPLANIYFCSVVPKIASSALTVVLLKAENSQLLSMKKATLESPSTQDEFKG